MGSYDLDESLRQLGESLRTISLDRELTIKWSESVKLVIEDFPTKNGEVMESRSVDRNADSLGALEGELVLLKAAYALSNVNRRLSLSKLLDLQGNVRVVCRVRPFLPCELSPTEASPVEVLSPTEVRVSCPGEPTKTFRFDRVFPPTASQEDVFSDVQPIVKSAMDGHNVCIFSYGQTGTGKTYTMEGDKSSPGVVPRALKQLFKDKDLQNTFHSFRLTLSMLEIYKGALRDLLVPRSTRIADPPPKTLSIHMSPSEHVEVENLTEYVIENAADALKFYRKGMRARSTSPTSSNETSSRSHCLVRVSITRSTPAEEGRAPKSSVTKLWLIDLGGSERFFKTQAWGKPLEEGKAINVSLSALGDVISALQKKQPHIPYRNSKLTQILRDCLGCTSKVVMFVHGSPKAEDYGETICSLSFASRARGIHLHRAKKETRVSGIAEKMEALEGECQRLSVDIQALESMIKEKKAGAVHGSDVKLGGKSTLQLEHHESSKLHGRKSDQLASLPRFMTPTISSLCKNRSMIHDFEPVWPEKKLSKALSMSCKPGGTLSSFVIGSPQVLSVDLGGRRPSSIISRTRKSTGGDLHHQLCIQATPWNYNHRAAELDDGSSPTKSSKTHIRNGSKDARNFSKIQRRLTLECSSKVSVHI